MSDLVQTGFLVLGGATVYVCLGAGGVAALIAGAVALCVFGIRKRWHK